MAMLVITRGYLFSLAQNIAFERAACKVWMLKAAHPEVSGWDVFQRVDMETEMETIGKSKHEPRNVQIWTLKWSKSNVRSSRATCEKGTTASVPWQSHAQKVAGPHESRQGIIPAPGYKIRKIQ